MNRQNYRWLEAQMVLQCAPVLAGLKPSNLLIVPKWAAECLGEMLQGTKVSYYCMAEHGEKVIYLIYKATELVRYLMEQEVQDKA